MSDAWQHAESFSVTNVKMLDDDVLCDVTILAGTDKREMRCHRFILASRSPVFYTMFCGSLPETGVVEIPDVEADVFQQVIRYLYTNDIVITPESVMAIMYMANKYDIQQLTKCCQEYLEEKMSVENVCVILDQAVKFEEKELEKKCYLFIAENSTEVFATEGFQVLSRGTLETVLAKEQDNHKLKPEDIYIACAKWAKTQCLMESPSDITNAKLRAKLGNLVDMINFCKMTYDSFIDNVSYDNILTGDEKVRYLQDIRKETTKPKSAFVVERLLIVTSSWTYGGFQDGISFRVSDDVTLCGVALYLPCEIGQVTGSLTVLQGQTPVLSQTITLQYRPEIKYEIIIFSSKIPVRSGTIYSVRQTLLGTKTYRGENYRGKQCVQGVEIEFLELNFGQSDNGTRLERGQFHGLMFEK
ncbi:BTB/POZ domain-containing protein 6-like [Mya arenaria]|nr:BTB/POZ domain-containing protein 6-like [Mya arenaria]